MDKELKLTLADDGIIVEVEGKKLKVSYKQAELPFAKARDWCKENGGGDESVENLRLVAKYRDKINEQLKAAGKGEIFGWYWSNEESWRYTTSACVVCSGNGDVSYNGMSCNNYVRAVSAL
jgi:hypothetical protein